MEYDGELGNLLYQPEMEEWGWRLVKIRNGKCFVGKVDDTLGQHAVFTFVISGRPGQWVNHTGEERTCRQITLQEDDEMDEVDEEELRMMLFEAKPWQ